MNNQPTNNRAARPRLSLGQLANVAIEGSALGAAFFLVLAVGFFVLAAVVSVATGPDLAAVLFWEFIPWQFIAGIAVGAGVVVEFRTVEAEQGFFNDVRRDALQHDNRGPLARDYATTGGSNVCN